MGLHARLVPRDIHPIGSFFLFDRFVAAGMARHPNAFELAEVEERDNWQLTLFSDEVAVVSVEEDSQFHSHVYAEARIPGTTDAKAIINWAHHLWRIAQHANCDVFFGDPRAIMILSSYLHREVNGQWCLTMQPPLFEVEDGRFDMPDPDHPLWKLSEADALVYVERALDERQEYDAGNAILFLIGTNRLSENGANKITDLLVHRECGFESKIGERLYPKVCQALCSLHLRLGNLDQAKRLEDRGYLA